MLTPLQVSQFRGHPTSPGQRDFPGVSPLTNLPTTTANLSVLPVGVSTWTKDGKPGTPRYVAPLPRDQHADPATFAEGVKMQYYGELPHAGFEPWNSRNEKLRRAVIQAAQAGSN
jgi:hypothetical protein